MRAIIFAAGLCGVIATCAAVSQAVAEESLFQKLGGRPGITQIANDSVDRMVADERVKDDFDNVNLARLKQRLADQICQLADGPCVYKGRNMRASHAGLGLNRAKFNAVAEDLQAAMQNAGVPYWTQNRLLALLAPMQRDIVTR